jgi:hypothetical protein
MRSRYSRSCERGARRSLSENASDDNCEAFGTLGTTHALARIDALANWTQKSSWISALKKWIGVPIVIEDVR